MGGIVFNFRPPKISLKEAEKIHRCWYCRYYNKESIVDKFGCCKRCGTNLRVFPNRKDIPPYPDLKDGLEREVLGRFTPFVIPPIGYYFD